MTETLHLIAHIAGHALAFDSRRIDSVIDVGEITPAPRALPGIVGLTALRSRVLAVVDPRHVLGLPPAALAPTRAVVAQVDGHAYAILVDALDDVATDGMIPVPAGVALQGVWADAGDMLLDRPGEPTLVVDPARLVPHGQSLAA